MESYRLSVFDVLSDVWLFVRHNYLTLAEKLFLPGLFSIFSIVTAYQIDSQESDSSGLVLDIILFIPFIYTAISCHRLYIIGAGSVYRLGYRAIDKRDLEYLIVLVSMVFFIMLIAMIVTVFSSYVFSESLIAVSLLVIYLLTAYLFTRFSLLLPMAAVECKPNYRKTLALANNNMLPLFCLVILVPSVLGSLIEYWQPDTVLLQLVIGIISYVIYVFELFLLSRCYYLLKLNRGDLFR